MLGIAAEYTTESVPVPRRDQRVGEVSEQLAGREFRCAEGSSVSSRERLVDLVSIERLLAADAKAGGEDIMAGYPIRSAPPGAVVDRHECSLAVVDADGRFLGLIPP